MSRLSKEEYFMKIAELAAMRSTCPKRHVGSCLVKDGYVKATAYNGSAKGQSHCDEVGCLENSEGHCQRASHSETNILCQAAYAGIVTKGAELYVTDYPCNHCLKNLINAGIKRIFYRRPYKNHENFIDLSNLIITQL